MQQDRQPRPCDSDLNLIQKVPPSVSVSELFSQTDSDGDDDSLIELTEIEAESEGGSGE